MIEPRPNDHTFVYVTYIRAAADDVWKALTEPEFTTQYWGVTLVSDWCVGSPVRWLEGQARISDPEQIVLESDRPHRLAYMWHTFTENWAEIHGFDEQLRQRLAAEPRSRVLFEIEGVEDRIVRLTLTHDFGGAFVLDSMCSEAWPRLLSDLKTILES